MTAGVFSSSCCASAFASSRQKSSASLDLVESAFISARSSRSPACKSWRQTPCGCAWRASHRPSKTKDPSRCDSGFGRRPISRRLPSKGTQELGLTRLHAFLQHHRRISLDTSAFIYHWKLILDMWVLSHLRMAGTTGQCSGNVHNHFDRIACSTVSGLQGATSG